MQRSYPRHTIFSCVRLVLSLLLLDGAVIVHEGKGCFVVGVLVALGSAVSRTEVALLPISGSSPGRQLGPALPLDRTLGACSLPAPPVDLWQPCQPANVGRAQSGRSLLPGPLGSVRGDQQPGAAERIVPPMGDVVEDLVVHGELVELEVPVGKQSANVTNEVV